MEINIPSTVFKMQIIVVLLLLSLFTASSDATIRGSNRSALSSRIPVKARAISRRPRFYYLATDQPASTSTHPTAISFRHQKFQFVAKWLLNMPSFFKGKRINTDEGKSATEKGRERYARQDYEGALQAFTEVRYSHSVIFEGDLLS